MRRVVDKRGTRLRIFRMNRLAAMAGRIRSIKPEILEDMKAASLTDTEWRLFVSLFLLADDHGNFRAVPEWISGQVFWIAKPDRTPTIEVLAELVRHGLVSLYTVRGQPYGSIVNWKKHQRVDKPGPPRVPGPSEASSSPPEAQFAKPRERVAKVPDSLANIPGPLAPDPDPDLDPDRVREADRDREGRLSRKHAASATAPDGPVRAAAEVVGPKDPATDPDEEQPQPARRPPAPGPVQVAGLVAQFEQRAAEVVAKQKTSTTPTHPAPGTTAAQPQEKA